MAVVESVEQQADSFVRSPHKLLIDGDWVEAASGHTFETLNPATHGGQARPSCATSTPISAIRGTRPCWRRRYGDLARAWSRLGPVPGAGEPPQRRPSKEFR
jgi:hypothetical protein